MAANRGDISRRRNSFNSVQGNRGQEVQGLMLGYEFLMRPIQVSLGVLLTKVT